MGKIYYHKNAKGKKKLVLRILSFGVFSLGIVIIIYVFFPLISWQIYFAPVFANQDIAAPIPENTIVSKSTISSLIYEASNSLSGVDYTNATTWFPDFKYQKNDAPKTAFYSITIPKLKIKNAIVSTVDIDLASHLVNYGGTAIPPDKGNAVVFGHSTLPQLYNEKSYKTVFTYLYELTPGDEIIVSANSVIYKYKVENITVVDPDNTSVLQQSYDDSFLTLVTCTPPGTIWKRLVVKARLEGLE